VPVGKLLKELSVLGRRGRGFGEGGKVEGKGGTREGPKVGWEYGRWERNTVREGVLFQEHVGSD
jgi:hypothetical protein